MKLNKVFEMMTNEFHRYALLQYAPTNATLNNPS